MRSVLFISLMNGAAWGGSEEMWYRTALWMSARGYTVAVGCYDWPEKNEKLDRLRKNGCSLYLLPHKKSFWRRSIIRKILKNIPFDQYDLVFVNQGGWKEVSDPPFATLYTRLKKYLLCFHNYDQQARLSTRRKQALQNWMRNASKNIGAAQRIFDVLLQQFGLSATRPEVWVNPITFAPPSSATEYPQLINGNYIWIMLSELDTARKAQDQLVKTLASEKWKLRNWELHLYGKGKDLDLLRDLVAQSGLANKVFLDGYTKNVEETIRKAHLLLQCTRIDAMPISVAEAMSMARPCVVSDVGDMPLWISPGVNGFICPGIAVEKMDETLEECWSRRTEWEEMGKKAFAFFSEKYVTPFEESIAKKLENT